MKRLLTIFSLIIPMLLTAQQTAGIWEMFPTYGASSRLIDTPDYVFNLTGTSLTGIDKVNNEVIAFNRTHRLNTNKVKNIWYNPKGRYLFVLHTDYNVDILHDDGRTTNIADMAHAVIDMPTVNDVAFYGDYAYLATTKGLIVIDVAHGLITENALHGTNLMRVVATEKTLVVKPASNNYLYCAERLGHHNNFSQYYKKNNVQIYSNGGLLAFGNNKMLGVGNGSERKLQLFTIDDNASLNNRISGGVVKTSDGVERYALQQSLAHTSGNGASALWAGTAFYNIYFDADGNIVSFNDLDLPDFKQTGKEFLPLTTYDASNPTVLWAANENGISRQDAVNNREVSSPVKPSSTVCTNVGQILPFGDGRLLLTTVRCGNDGVTSSLQGTGSTAKFEVLHPDGTTEVLPAVNVTTKYQAAINPKNKDEIVVSARNYVIRYNIATGERTVYDATNTPMAADWTESQVTLLVYSLAFDTDGNLWVIQNNDINNNVSYNLLMVPAAAWNDNPQKSDWQVVKLPASLIMNHSTNMAFISSSKGAVMVSGSDMLACVNLNNTLSDTSDDRVAMVDVSKDTDGMTVDASVSRDMTFDQNGMIWVCTAGGIITFPSADRFFEADNAASRPKVPRNDGTGLADHLLANIDCFCIHVDANNSKWIGTLGSGLYRVNTDGTQILQHFSTDNSDIPSDNILAIYADPESNKVYVGTDNGLAILHSTSSPASSDMNGIYAYPNPVTPDYTGYITVAGLMDNSLVKIADAQGNVFRQGVSDGGSYMWDGCDASGARVKSGIYYVFASQQDGSRAATTKIVVVN